VCERVWKRNEKKRKMKVEERRKGELKVDGGRNPK